MAFARPTLQDLITRISGDFRSRLTLTGALLRRAFVYVCARVYAGVAHLMHGHLDYISRQIFTDSMDDENVVREADMYGLAKTVAQFAIGQVTFTGVDGSVIPNLTPLVRSDAVRYLTDALVMIVAGVATVGVTCATAGEIGNGDAGTALLLESPIAGVVAESTVGVDGLALGADQESTDSLRSRLRDRKRSQPTGGSNDDYSIWARAVSGVTRVWVYPLELGAGAVTVRFVTDNDPGGIIPAGPKVAEVQAYIDARRPVTATVTVLAPVAAPINYTLHVTPDTAEIRAAITAELDDLHTRDAIPGGTIYFSRINEAISGAEGEFDHLVTVPAADVPNATGLIATRGVVTFI
jgi:uncharacterized phage protein gp47/JayE